VLCGEYRVFEGEGIVKITNSQCDSLQGRSDSPRDRPNCADRWTRWPGVWIAERRHPHCWTRSTASHELSFHEDEGGGSRLRNRLEVRSARLRLPAVQASSKPTTRSILNRLCVVIPSQLSRRPLSSKLVFISVRTWRATGASSCTAFSRWASLSLRLAEPPCVPSRRSAK
jgi:hypothetical protein